MVFQVLKRGKITKYYFEVALKGAYYICYFNEAVF